MFFKDKLKNIKEMKMPYIWYLCGKPVNNSTFWLLNIKETLSLKSLQFP